MIEKDEVLVRVEGVGKKFCRSLKKSLWYGVCDIASELNPFGRVERMPASYKYLNTELTEDTEERSGSNQRADSAEFLEGHSQAGLKMDSEKLASIRSANDSRASGANASSAKIGEICGKNAEGLRPGEFWAVKDVSFELRRGELRTLGRSEKEISKKCLGATKVPDSERSRHQCLGLIGHNGAGNQAEGQPLGRLPQVARRVRRRGKARINMTLLKMLNGLIKPDRGTITMRGRVGALIALGAGFNPILTGREPEGWEACRLRRLGKSLGRLPLAACRVR
jgi:hypothetical protein